MTLGKKIKELRKRYKITQKELAEIMNVSLASIGFYEADKRTPSIDKIILFRNAFDIAPEEFDVDNYNLTEYLQYPNMIRIDSEFLDSVSRALENVQTNSTSYSQALLEKIIERASTGNEYMYLIDTYNKLNVEGKEKLIKYAEDLASIDKYIDD